ncbi:MAG: zinc-binding dehydrogenase [Spirochaetales bacterium]|nr:zinc-binding dehydrogenase [Spirochaetales bacterium]
MSYNRVIIDTFGSPEVLKFVNEDVMPEPGRGEVRIKVTVVSACFTDTMVRKGIYFGMKKKPPFSPGYDMVGVIDKTGPEASLFKIGDRVADLTVTGSYTEYICLPESSLTPIPDGIDDGEAVSMVLSYVTAYQMLNRAAHVRKGQSILVHGAGGAVGTALLQLASVMDIKVYGTGSSSKQELIHNLGAIPIDYKTESIFDRMMELEPQGIDAAFDAIGGESFKTSFRLLKRGGILVPYGFYKNSTGQGGNVAFEFLRLKLWNLLPNTKKVQFYSIGDVRKRHPEWFKEDLSALFTMLMEGYVSPVIAKRLPLREAKTAHEMIENASVGGRILLQVGL